MADDDQDDQHLLREAVENSATDVQVVCSDSGEQLVKTLKDVDSLEESVVVVDMNMPGMNGLETIKAIKADANLSHLPTVMLSTSSNPELAQSAIRAGASEFVTKPTSFGALLILAKKIFQYFFSYRIAS